MKKNYTFTLLFSIVLFSACEKSDTSLDSFAIVDKIVNYDSLWSDKHALVGAITDIEIVDSVLIAEHMNDEYNYSFINASDGKLLRRWGRIGDAPGEYIDFGSDFTISDSRLVFLERAKKEINYVSISDILKGSDSLSVIKESYPYTADFRPGRMRILNDKKIFLGSFKKGRLGVLDSKNEIVDSSSDYPFDCGVVTGIYRGSVFQGKMKSNNKQSKFVVSTFSSDIFEIYQNSGSGIHRVYVSHFDYIPQVWEKGGRYTTDDAKNIAGLMKIAVSDDLICFTYSLLNRDEMLGLGSVSDEILCFDWNGEKVKKYILPFPVSAFCLDKHYIYGVRNYNDEIIIYRFNL